MTSTLATLFNLNVGTGICNTTRFGSQGFEGIVVCVLDGDLKSSPVRAVHPPTQVSQIQLPERSEKVLRVEA
jgi:hypothetical protein